ncbi:hypothetical protein KI387_016190, partial [Taxus chinensis]
LFTEYRNMDECQSYIENYMIQHGPFDGLLGFSQGAILSAALVGLQSMGIALTRVPPVQFVIIISGGKFKAVHISQVAYSSAIKCPSVHFLGCNNNDRRKWGGYGRSTWIHSAIPCADKPTSSPCPIRLSLYLPPSTGVPSNMALDAESSFK